MFGGFSMGSVMSYSMGLTADRPEPAGLLIFSGFIPTVEGWTQARRDVPAFIAHGRNDPIMDVAFAREAREKLDDVSYHESDAAHHIDPAHVPAAVQWVADHLPTTKD